MSELDDLKSQVTRLESELLNVTRNRDSILLEKREAQDKLKSERLLTAAAEHMPGRDRDNIPAQFRREERGIPAGEAAFTLTREEARDTKRYRAAAEAAKAAGRKNGPILLDPDSGPAAKDEADVRTVHTERAIYVRRDVYRQPQEFKRLRAAADLTGRRLAMFETRAHLAALADEDPDAAPAFDKAAAERPTPKPEGGQ